ncbi:MAG: hypothetical protein ABJB66_10440 [Gemmatimonadaceae bacterium]
MYATCLFCHSPLGANESIEHFPVGRRLAYDAAKGRLWVVCSKCERWNLSPLEERWEAIEEAERAYRDTKKRVATDNIGLARLHDGTELIRIGVPLRPEFAAWRYGDQFGKRRRREWLIAGGGSAVVLAVALGGPALGIAIGGGGALVNILNVGSLLYQRFVPRVHVTDAEGNFLAISGFDLRKANFMFSTNDNAIHVEFPYRDWQASRRLLTTAMMTLKPGLLSSSYAALDGEVAVRAMAAMLPALNGAGGSARQVSRAVAAVEQNQNSVPTLLREALIATPASSYRRRMGQGSASLIPKPLRLALEMSLHEADERRALEGELKELEERWKQAEEVAAIADGLTLPANTEATLENLREKGTSPE